MPGPSRPFLGARSARVPLLALAALVTLACDDDPAALLAGGDLAAAAGGGGGGASLEVTVLAPDGTPVADRTVIAVSSVDGPYRADGTLRYGLTDTDGVASIDAERGDYCVYTTPVRIETLRPGAGGPPAVPPVGGASIEPPVAQDLGTALTGEKSGQDFESLPLTLSNWVTYCVQSPPLAHRGNTGLTLVLQPPASLPVTGTFVDAGGAPQQLAAWLLVDLSGLTLPWTLPASTVADVKPGLFFAVDPQAGPDGSFELPTPGGPVAVESQLVPVGTGFQSASKRLDGTTLEAGTVPLGAEFCRVNAIEELAGDGNALDLVGPYRHGFLADELLAPVTTAIAVEYRQEGEGSATFRLRERTGGTDQLKVDYSCTSAGCATDRAVGAFPFRFAARRLSVPATAEPAYAISFVVSGLPEDPDLETGVDTNGDQIPDASKSDATAALVATPVPSSCVSEESRFILGG